MESARADASLPVSPIPWNMAGRALESGRLMLRLSVMRYLAVRLAPQWDDPGLRGTYAERKEPE